MRQVADGSPIPVYLYDIPAFTSPMTFETIVALSAHPNIHGLKDSSRDFARFQGLLSTIKAARPDFKIFTGSEELLLASLMFGADGATVATGGIEPEKIMAIVEAWRQGDFQRAKAIQFELLPLIRSWFVKDFPEGFRDAVAAKGFL
jgi:N-acetylneuraminate lyase/4-hydroxy-tetrahydrodipicolinate synthase